MNEAYATMKDRGEYIPEDSTANLAIQKWFEDIPDRESSCASPSGLTKCPRVIWLEKHKVAKPNPMTWAFKQRMLLGRNFENQIAKQYEKAGQLLHHWKDDVAGESEPFIMGEGDYRIIGTPDLLLKFDKVYISDAKTSRSDSFSYVPVDESVWEDVFWFKYKLQVSAYFMLAVKNSSWFYEYDLPLPEACHLFSFALDDGVVRREFTWTVDEELEKQVWAYAKRWNQAYKSETIPDCTCSPVETKLCQYAYEFEYTKKGKKVGTKCCGENHVI